MNESNKILLIAGGLYLIAAVTGFYFGLAFDKSRQLYEIIAYLFIYQTFVFLILCEPLSRLAFRYKIFMIGFIALIITGQLLNDSRKFYPFSSWTMYSRTSADGSVILMQSINEQDLVLELKTGLFSPARSSRPHEQLFTSIIKNRESEPDRFHVLMSYYCKIVKDKSMESKHLQVQQVQFNSDGIISNREILLNYNCDES